VLAQTYLSGDSAVNIARSIESAVAAGKIAGGSLLPTVRKAAKHLNVSPATVAAAYRALGQRGVIIADGRRGTRVRHAPPIAMPVAAPLPSFVRDLASGNPDPELLPRIPKLPHEQRLYRDDLNDPLLLDLARGQFEADDVPGAHIAVIGGALDGVERVLREHLKPGDRVAVEDPCFTGVLDLLSALTLVAVPVTVDAEGLQPDTLRRVLRGNVQALIVTPRAQNPSGAAITIARQRALKAVLAKHPDVLLIEDDHAGPVAGVEYRTLADRSREKWAVVRSVSKSLGPDLRVALLAADARTIARVEGRQTLGIRWVSHILQRIVVAMWSDHRVQQLLNRAGSTYTARRDALLRELRIRGIESHGESGLNVWIPVREETPVVQAMMASGWAVQAGERYRLTTGPAIRITIAALDSDDAERVAEDLARILKPSPARARTFRAYTP
jgi:DNA-binding transcriptional MocR family regulator